MLALNFPYFCPLWSSNDVWTVPNIGDLWLRKNKWIRPIHVKFLHNCLISFGFFVSNINTNHDTAHNITYAQVYAFYITVWVQACHIENSNLIARIRYTGQTWFWKISSIYEKWHVIWFWFINKNEFLP